jgi:hypothetical protein
MNNGSNVVDVGATIANPPAVPQQHMPAVYLTAGDVAERISTSVTTVKRVAAEMRLDVLHTVGGLRLFTAEQAEKIRAEIDRRHRGDWRRS